MNDGLIVFPSVGFPSLLSSGTFSVKVTPSVEGGVPFSILIESNRSHTTWARNVSTFQDFAAQTFELDDKDVFDALLTSLQERQTSAFRGRSTVDLIAPPPLLGSLVLLLAMQLEGTKTAGFSIDLETVVPLENKSLVKQIDVLRLQGLSGTKNIVVALSPTQDVAPRTFVAWRAAQMSPEDVTLSNDAIEIVFLSRGGYLIEVRGHVVMESTSVELLVNKMDVATSKSYGKFLHLTHLVVIRASTLVVLRNRGSHTLSKSTTLTIERL
ncbi:hypothetical protein Ae201684P_000659 [Aphanomyces euteiches]|uniref:Uncharacterized protein n=1 Tax=Aphanomyces euteiches TaxID=100861 RepID=A0A6G0W950_9STRA|nr:hypothetical protein Ae201684_017926 [Aphanomyces euteiches]KAH9087248.1 hypothetical protein Ae201684P_000659 [Aphanomyces euteiches]